MFCCGFAVVGAFADIPSPRRLAAGDDVDVDVDDTYLCIHTLHTLRYVYLSIYL